jgi:multiple sugar transport system permease protein
MTPVRTADRLLAAFQVIHWRNTGFMIVLGAGAVIMFLPFMWMFASSMRPVGEAFGLPPSFWPARLSFDAYAELLHSKVPFLRMYLNSLIVAATTTLGVIITSATAAFAFSRLSFRGKEPIFALLLLGLMVPPSLVLIPLFFGFARLGLLDTIWSLVLPAIASPLGIFMMRQFMAGQPREYEEAAMLDGAGYWRIFFSISLPQMGPPIAALSIITFTQSWNNFVIPLVMTRHMDAMTLPVGLLIVADTYGDFSFAALMAAVTMAVLPLFVVFLVAQRFIVEGLTSSGLKG